MLQLFGDYVGTVREDGLRWANPFLALKRWADDDLRSINGQVEFLRRRALEQAGRLHRESAETGAPPEDTDKKRRPQ